MNEAAAYDVSQTRVALKANPEGTAAMRLATIVRITAASGLALAGCGGQDPASSQSSALPAPVKGVYPLQIEAATAAGLPKCTSALAGTVAYVTSPAGLWACSGGNWCQINCTPSSAGDVAYASSTQTLVACVANAWTPVALPQGPKGDAGPSGPQGPQGNTGATGGIGPQGLQGIAGKAGATGAQGQQGEGGAVSLVLQSPASSSACPNGGTEIQSGLDLNGDSVLQSTEVTSISYVCNGALGEAGAPGPQGAPGSQVQVTPEAPGSNCAAGGERIDVGQMVDGGFEIEQTAYVCNGANPGVNADAATEGGEAIGRDASAAATPYRHTILIDGVNEFAPSETFQTTTPAYAAYVAWDATNLYVGYEGEDIGGSSANKWLFAYLDTDPGAGTGARVADTYGTQNPSFPSGFGADYYVAWRTDNSSNATKEYSGGSWSTSGAPIVPFRLGSFVEIAIPLATLGAPSKVGVETFLMNSLGGQESTYAGIYSNNLVDGYGASPTEYLLADFSLAIAPNAPSSETP